MVAGPTQGEAQTRFSFAFLVTAKREETPRDLVRDRRFLAEENDATEEEVTREGTTRVGRPRGGMKVAARSGERLRKEIGRGRSPRVGDG